MRHEDLVLPVAVDSAPTDGFVPLSRAATVAAAAIAAVGYVVAFATPNGAAAILVALPALCLLSRQRAAWISFGVGWATGVAIYATLLSFMINVFGAFSAVLWLLGALHFGVFVLLLNVAHRRLGPTWALCLTPMLWTGTEYFRSEVWALRFAWLLPGQAPAFLPGVRYVALGVYGLGFVYMLLSAIAVAPSRWLRTTGAVGLAAAAVLMYWPALPAESNDAPLHVAGVQTEQWESSDVARALDDLATSHPEAQILVLSEYAFSDSVPAEVRDVVIKHGRYLIAGGRVRLSDGGYYNAAFVIGPDGSDVFQQVKSVPVQFMSDGLPATEWRVWESPWGKIGIAICYDFCFAKVMDDFVRQGASGLIIPTMDVAQWGEFERRMLHGRTAPVRSAEYGIPTFGVWSSGVSQLTDRHGRLVATAGYPGQGETIAGSFDLSRPGRIPPDRFIARASLVGTGLFIAYALVRAIRRGTR
jgi:apolipoprotein N-acyltransferase